MLIDLHVHTSLHSPCSILEFEDLVNAALEKEIDGFVLTEHNYLWGKSELEKMCDRMEKDLLILRGVEFDTLFGHISVINCYRDIEKLKLMVYNEKGFGEFVEAVHNQGGILIAVHPVRRGLSTNPRAFDYQIDAIEVMSANLSPEEQEEAAALARQLGLPGVAGSDAHSLEMFGTYASYLKKNIRNGDELVEEIKSKRVIPLCLKPPPAE